MLSEEELALMYQKKAEFVKKLCEFYKAEIGTLTIEDMEYVRDSTDSEWVYVKYSGDSQQRFCVDGSNENGIFHDFANFTRNRHEYPWLNGDQRI